MSGEDHFGMKLGSDLFASWTWMPKSFSMFGRFSIIIPLNKLFAIFSISSPSETQIIHMLILFMVFHILSSLFFILYCCCSPLSSFKFPIFQLTDSSVWSTLILMLSIAAFILFVDLFSSRISVWFFFNDFYLFIKFLIFCGCIVYLILLNCLSVFSCNSLSLLKKKQLVWIVYQVSYSSLSLVSVTGWLLWSFDDLMFLWFFMFLGVLHCCLHIWNRSHLLQSLLTAIVGVILSISPA